MSSVLVIASRDVREKARALGYDGIIEVDVERAIESSEPRLRIGRERCYRLSKQLSVRVRDNGRTGGGRKKIELLNVIDLGRAGK